MTLKVGAAKLDVTPPIGVMMAGYGARLTPCEGIHDPLYARALALVSGQRAAVMLSLDLAGLDISLCERIRRAVEGLTSVSRDCVVVAATHTHSGPQTGRYGADWADKGWVAQLVRKAASCAAEALRRARPTAVGYGEGDAGEVAENRREPGGPVDPRVRVLALDDLETGEPLATVVNFSMHPVVLRANNTLISADYPGYLCRFLEEWGAGVAVFLQGTCGDVRPRLRGTDDLEESFRRAERVGRIVAAEALKARDLAWDLRADVSVEARSAEYQLEVRPLPTLREVREALESVQASLASAKGPEERAQLGVRLYALRRLRFLLESRVVSGRITTTSTYVSLGSVAHLLTIPGEPLTRFGLELREELGLEHLMLVGYANDYVGYVPSAEDLRRGGYEASTPWCVLTERSVGEMLSALRGLARGGP